MELAGRQVFRQFDGAVVLVDLDRADQAAGQFGFVGDGANDVARFDAMIVADLNPVAAHDLVTFTLVAAGSAILTTATCCMSGLATSTRFLDHLWFFQDQRLTLEHHHRQSGGHVVVADVHALA